MVKLIQNSNNKLKSILSDTKCAEIHYFTSNFNIVCLACQEIYHEYEEFIKHYQDLHFLELMENLKNVDSKNDSLLQETKKKCVKMEIPELLEQTKLYKDMEPQARIDESLKDCEESICDKEHITQNLATKINQMNENDTKGVQSFVLEEISSDIDWSLSFTPLNLKLKEKRSYKPRNQPNSCSYCGKTFRRRYQLDTHINIHTGLKPHQCDVCGLQFRAITTLQRHLNTHEIKQTYNCQFCPKQFTHRAAFISHETRHTQERYIPCDDCNKLFYTQNQLDTHKLKLHNKLGDCLPYACDICPKSYRSASMLSTHKFKKHYKMAKYKCEQCDKKFVEQSQLNKHMSIHFKTC